MTGDHRSRHRGDHDGAELGDAKIAENDFHSEKRTGNRRIKGGGNAGGGSARHQGTQPGAGHLKELPDHRAEGGADLHDRPFPPGGAARSDTDGRSGHLGEHHPGTNHPGAQHNRFHHLRHPVAFGFPRKVEHDRPDNQSPRRRGQELHIPGQLQGVIQGVFPGAEEERFKKTNRIAEKDRPESPQDADQHRHHHHERMLGHFPAGYFIGDHAPASFEARGDFR